MSVALYSDEHERAVLGASLLSTDALDQAMEILPGPEVFYFERHQLLWTAICAVRESGSRPDGRTVQAYMESAGTFDTAGGLAYFVGLDLELPDLSQVPEYASYVRERYQRRQLSDLALWVHDSTRNAPDETATQVAAIRRRLDDIEQIHQVGEPLQICDVLEAAAPPDQYQEMVGLSVGDPATDSMMSGLQQGRLVVVAGRPGMGKSALAQTWALSLASSGHSVLLVSFEMGSVEITRRCLASMSGIPLNNIETGRLTDDQWGMHYQGERKLFELPLWIESKLRPQQAAVAALARRWHRSRGLKVLIVDYLQLMHGDSTRDGRVREIAMITSSLKALALELDIPIVLLSQLSRECEKRENKRPRLSDLRESGAIEQDADVVWFVYRDWIYNKSASEYEAELICAKNRSGRTGTVETTFHGEYMRFVPLERRQQEWAA